MRILAYSLATYAIYTFQSTFIAIFAKTSFKPDLPLVVVLCVGLLKGEMVGGIAGLVNGLLDDIIYGSFLGLSALAKFFSSYILGYLTRNVYKGPILITMMTVFLGSLIYHLLVVVLGIFTGTLISPWQSFLTLSINSAFCNMIISPLVFIVIVKMEGFFDHYFDIRY